MTEHLSKMADEVFEAMRGFVARSLESVLVRVDALERRAPEKGVDGLKGKDADEAAITEKVLEQVAKALESIPSPKDGKDGTDGKSIDPEELKALVESQLVERVKSLPAGERGTDGKDADPEVVADLVLAKIPTPADGEKGDRGDAGEKGDKGIDGRDGLEGERGRDAAHLEIQPLIDEAKAYPRNTYARHAGGLWRSFEKTAGMKGWECIVEGVAGIEVDMVGDRGVTIKSVLSSGAADETSFKVATVIDREVFKEGQKYEKGDGVTWGRHYWIARKDTEAKPEVGPDWRLAVKSGRDGKDAEATYKALTMQEITAVIVKDIGERGPIWRALEKDPPIR